MELDAIGVSPAKRKQFYSRGISNVEELLAFAPRKYKDYTQITGILPSDQVSCVEAVVLSTSSRNAGRIPFVSATCQEVLSGEVIHVTWFNSPWIYPQIMGYTHKHVFIIGRITFSDQYGYSIVKPEAFDDKKCLGIYPVYKGISGMSSEYLKTKIEEALRVGTDNSEILPPEIIEREGELPMPTALRYTHQPKTMEESEKGIQRLLLNDLVYFALHNELNKNELPKGSQFNIKSLGLMKAIKKDLPFQLTPDQEKAVDEMISLVRDGRRLQSLILGDVGSGKTVTAALLAASFVGSGYQVVIMAPTQVLAKQHYESMLGLFSPYGIKITYLDSSLKTKERRELLKEISSGDAKLVVGTHSCIGRDVVYNKLALTVVDEEHKFGVKQRNAIVGKAATGAHSITMSATPIPRSLAQVLYGEDIHLHIIKTMPAGRKPIITGIARDQQKVFKFLAREIQKGHQAYVVCPAIDTSEIVPELCSVESVAEEYKKKLGPLGIRIGTLTGRDEKGAIEDTINRFKNRDLDILIATTVIEVGVNVPNATAMVIHNAERFGLSGLHQLRGRVGRSDLQSYCVLSSESQDEKALYRLNAMCQVSDGFQIAETDLKLRGAGDFLGTQQSGQNKYVMQMLAYPERYQTAVKIAHELIDLGLDCCPLTQIVEKERRQQE